MTTPWPVDSGAAFSFITMRRPWNGARPKVARSALTIPRSVPASPLVLLDADGEKLALDVGQTWILIAPHGAELRRHEPGGNG